MLEQQQADHEAALNNWAALAAVERRDLVVDPCPVDLAAKLRQLVLHVDDLVEPGPEKIAFPIVSCFFGRIVFSDAAIESQLAGRGNPKAKSQGSTPSERQTLQSKTLYWTENRFLFNRLAVVHGPLSRWSTLRRAACHR
jgi:hypothetical protein